MIFVSYKYHIDNKYLIFFFQIFITLFTYNNWALNHKKKQDLVKPRFRVVLKN